MRSREFIGHLGQRSGHAVVPGLLPAEPLEQPRHDACGEAPQRHPRAHLEPPRPCQPDVWIDAEPVGRIEQPADPRRTPRADLLGADRLAAAWARASSPAPESPRSCSAAATASATCRRPRHSSAPSPTSSWASRNAVAMASASPGSVAPPGNEIWPAWLRILAARSVSSSSGPLSPSAKSISTAAGRASAGACGKRGASCLASTDPASSASGRSHSGRSLPPLSQARLALVMAPPPDASRSRPSGRHTNGTRRAPWRPLFLVRPRTRSGADR